MQLSFQRGPDRNEIYALISFGRKQKKGEKNTGLFFPVYVGMVDAAAVISPEIVIEWHGPYTWDPVAENEAIRQLTNLQIDGIIITSTGSNALDVAINDAIHAGIPVINFDGDSPESERLAFVGTNHFKAGYLAGQTMIEWLEGQGSVLVATTPFGDHLKARVQGFQAAIGELAPQMTLYTTYDMPSIQVGETLEQLSVRFREALTQMLQAHPDVRGVFVTFARAGSALAEVIELLQLQGLIQGLVFDIDGSVAQSVATDRLRAVVGQDMYLIGYVSLILAHAARHAPMMPTKHDGRWRIDALCHFLDGHPDIRQDIAHKLCAIIADLETHPCEPASPIEIKVEILGKEHIIEAVVSDFEHMRDSLADKIDALSKEIDIRREAEHELRRLNEELEARIQKRTATLEAANKELRDFAYVVSHDLKAPLRAISRLAHWLSQDYEEHFDEAGQNMVTLLIGRVKRLDNLIDGILQYSRVGRANTDEEPVDLNHLIPEVIDSLAVPEHARIIIEDALPVVRGNAIQLSQVFQNLLSNAIKFLDKPQGLITIRCQPQDATWVFTVTDNGPGIEERYWERIFEMFQTLTPRDQHESTGIGLAIVKKIVALYGGRVGVDSIVGEGSTFWFTLPKNLSET